MKNPGSTPPREHLKPCFCPRASRAAGFALVMSMRAHNRLPLPPPPPLMKILDPPLRECVTIVLLSLHHLNKTVISITNVTCNDFNNLTTTWMSHKCLNSLHIGVHPPYPRVQNHYLISSAFLGQVSFGESRSPPPPPPAPVKIKSEASW